MKNMIIVTFVSLGLFACASKKVETDTAAQAPVVPSPTKAHAVLKSAKGYKVSGMVHFTEEDGKMVVETMVDNLKAGPHGFHIHETGDCSAADFTSAGGHFNPHAHQHGDIGKGSHVGDMGNLVADRKNKAHTRFTVEGMTMVTGASSIIGKAVVIHKDKDDLKSQPAGNAGARIACGVIEALN